MPKYFNRIYKETVEFNEKQKNQRKDGSVDKNSTNKPTPRKTL
jgi:hypothetical protein